MTGAPAGLVAMVVAATVGLASSGAVFGGTLLLLGARTSRGPLFVRPIRLQLRTLNVILLAHVVVAALCLSAMDRGSFPDYLGWWLGLMLPFYLALSAAAAVVTAANFAAVYGGQNRRPWQIAIAARYRAVVASMLAVMLAVAWLATATPPWALGTKTYQGPGFSLRYPRTWGAAISDDPDNGGRVLNLRPPGAGETEGIAVSVDTTSPTMDDAVGATSLLFEFIGSGHADRRPVSVPGSEEAVDLVIDSPASVVYPLASVVKVRIAQVEDGFVVVLAQAVEQNYQDLADDFDVVFDSLTVTPNA